MRKLFTLMAVCFATAIAGGASISAANASPFTGVVHPLNVKPSGVVEKAYYYRRHYRRVARRHYRRAYYYGAVSPALLRWLSPPLSACLLWWCSSSPLSPCCSPCLSPGSLLLRRLALR